MLNLKAKNSHYIFDDAGMLVVKGDERSWRDSIGRTVLAWIAYKGSEELMYAISRCYQDGELYRHPEEKEKSSRDHWAYYIILHHMAEKVDPAYCHVGNIPPMRGMNLWIKSLAGNKCSQWGYYFWAIPGAYIGNAWLRFCRWAGRFARRGEAENYWWIRELEIISYNGLEVQLNRTPWQKLWSWIILNTIPAFALHIKAWQIYVMPESQSKAKLKKILLQRVGKSNLLVRLLLGDTVSEKDVSQYPDMTGYRPGVYLDESCRRDIREMTAEEAEFNNYEKKLIEYLYNEKCR